MKCRLFMCLGPEYIQLSEVLIVVHSVDMVVAIVFKKDLLHCLNDHVFYSLTHTLASYKREGKKRGPYKKDKPILKDDLDNSVDTMTDDTDDDD